MKHVLLFVLYDSMCHLCACVHDPSREGDQEATASRSEIYGQSSSSSQAGSRINLPSAW